jgi:diguanylate cyclase (GGDEF)-like protein
MDLLFPWRLRARERWSRPGLTWLTRRSLRGLSADERRLLVDAQVTATRPIISGVIASGAVMLALTGMFEAADAAPGIGYPWWVVELAAIAIAGCALATWHIAAWQPRLLLTLLGTLLMGVFMSVPVPGTTAALAVRTGLFQLLPIALLALLARPISIVSMLALVLGLAAVRAALHGVPSAGAALYWLYTFTTIGFGLLLGGYCTDFAVATFRIRQRLRQQASTDELTGLLNRAGWTRDATAAYASAVNRGQPLSFAFFDIDHFKHVNDTFGHDAGDRVLQSLGAIIRERDGSPSHCARLGGEEFVVLLVGQAPESVEGFVQRVRAGFAQAAAEYNVTVSAGIAHRQTAETMPQQLRRADLALYEAKAAGRDRAVVSRA